MAIPKYDELMIPVLEVLSDKKEHRITEIVDILAKKLKLTNEELEEKISSGSNKFAGRVGWARTYLKAAKLIDSTRRAYFVINERGEKALQDKPKDILNYLKQYNEFLEFVKPNKDEKTSDKNIQESKTDTPDEMLAHAQDMYKENLQTELLTRL